MAKRKMEIIAFVLCFCLFLMPCQVFATSTADAKEPISIDKSCSLTISYSCEESSFSALKVRLYKIADVSANYQYTLTPSFEKSTLVLNRIQNVSEWNVIRSTLETYILANKVNADVTAVTNQDGNVSFETLKSGLYLAIAERTTKEDVTYIFDSALIALPGLGSDGLWQYQVAAKAKCTIIPPPENDEKIEFKVTKLWKGDNGKTDRPKSIEVEIFRNGISYKTVNLSEDSHWTYRWEAKNDGSDWKIVERNIPAGYTMTVEERETSFVLTNTLNRDDPDVPDAPQTGETSNVMLWVILMIISGSMLIILGITGKRNRV